MFSIKKNRLYFTTRINEENINDKMLEYLLSNIVKIIIASDDIRIKSNSNINQSLTFTEKNFFPYSITITQLYSGLLDEIQSFIQLIPGSNGSDKPFNITGVDKVLLKSDCIDGSNVNRIREPILNSFGLTSPPGHKILRKPKIELFKKINICVLSNIIVYLEDDDHKPVDINNEEVSCTCRPMKKKYLNEL